MSKSENKDASGEQQGRHAEYIRHAINQVDALGGAQTEGLSEALSPSDPKQVGLYRILSVLGKGGMGKVYLAEQQPPLRRRVALKVIKADLDSEHVLARFEAERQALALLDHSNIAKVFDAGTTKEGRPYFAMEYIEGERITDYCDRHQLDTTARLRLFMQVCEGVQHAHQKAIIHRDIKPSNILVTEQDGKPVPKIIDFGVAKATEQRLTERSLQTEIGQIIGTLGYMSREQLRTPHDVDTRTDIYSLGVVLYELLVGEPPFDLTTLGHAARGEVERMIAEQEPLKPSTKLSSRGEVSWAAVAHNRQTDFRTLRRALATDLDWLVMMALEKDRDRRYKTASDFSEDVARFLRHEKLIARPPSRVYQGRKFVRRHRSGVAAVAAVVLALGIGFSVAVRQYKRAELAERETQQAYDAVQRMFLELIPDEAGTGPKTAIEIIDNFVGELPSQSLLDARLPFIIGEAYRKLGRYDKALPFARQALEIRERLLQPNNEELIASLESVGELQFRIGEYAEAERLLRSALTKARKLGAGGDETAASTMNRLGNSLSYRGAYGDAERFFEESLAIRRRLFGSKHWSVAETLQNLATTLMRAGKFEKALPLYREALGMSSESLEGEDERMYRDALAMVRESREPASGNVASILTNLGAYFEEQKGDHEKAASLFSEALAIRRKVFGDNSVAVAESLSNLAAVWERMGETKKAEPLHREALLIKRKRLGDEHLSVALSLNNLAAVLCKNGQLEEAERAAREGLRIFQAKAAPGDWKSLSVEDTLATVLAAQQHYAEAERLLLKAHEGLKDRKDCPPQIKQDVLTHMVDLYVAWNAVEPGKGYAEKAAEWRAKLEKEKGER